LNLFRRRIEQPARLGARWREATHGPQELARRNAERLRDLRDGGDAGISAPCLQRAQVRLREARCLREILKRPAEGLPSSSNLASEPHRGEGAPSGVPGTIDGRVTSFSDRIT